MSYNQRGIFQIKYSLYIVKAMRKVFKTIHEISKNVTVAVIHSRLELLQ